ncbi:septum formation family protein [Micromonospora sp. NPDC003197]
MRRWLTLGALGAVAALALTGCANPGGVDGDLTDDWAAVGELKIFVPENGTCHLDFSEVGYRSAYNPVDCGQSHRLETLHLGTFTGEDANRTSPPPVDSPSMRTARQECDTKVAEVLGGDWRNSRLELSIVLPSPQGWTGGARWFRCDLSENKSLDDPGLTLRSSSLKGALSSPSDLLLGCYNPKLVKDELDTMTPVACTAKHRAEFVGIFQAPDTSFDGMAADSIHRGCLGVVAKYAGVSNDSNMKYRAGTIYYPPSEEAWEAGERGIRCFLWIGDRDMTKSVKGGGSKALPIN